MPQRVINAWAVVLGIAGLLLVVALVVLGADLHRAARSGPRWKRRILAAALALLSGVGIFVSGPEVVAAWTAPTSGEIAAMPLADTPPWRRLMATWREAEAVATGQRGAYPFSRRQKERLLSELAAGAGEVDTLVTAAQLDVAEAELLKRELLRLTRGVDAKRPVEERNTTCYLPTPLFREQDVSLCRIVDRLPLLQSLLQARTVQPAVVAKVAATLEADLAGIRKAGYLERLKKMQADLAAADPGQARYTRRYLAAEHRRDAKASVMAARDALAGLQSLLARRATSPPWRAVVAAWRFGGPLAETHKSTTAQRKTADELLQAARAAVAGLVGAGELSQPEGDLLLAEADTLRQEIHRDPPTDAKVTCYDMMILPPARQSLARLQKRLPLLKAVVAAGTVRPAVCERVLPTLRADLATLADEKHLQQIQAPERDKARQLRKQAAETLAQIEKLLAPSR